MKFSVCTDAIFGGKISTAEAVGKVREAGLDGMEFWCWWEKDLPAIVAEAKRHNVEIAAFSTKVWNLVDPGKRSEYLAGLRDSLEAARMCGKPRLMSQVGNDNGAPREEQRASIIDGLRAAAPLCEAAGITLVIEPLNLRVDHPGYFLAKSSEAFDIIRAVGSPNVKVIFDMYHQQITEGDLTHNITSNIAEIGHFHVAGHPGRNEWDVGEINYPHLFRAIDKAGFKGRIGLEYWPKRDPMDGLRGLAKLAAE